MLHSASEVDLISPVPWKELDKEAKHIKGFLASLNCGQVGTGFMFFDRESFLLVPRSYWFNGRTLQWITTIGNKTANFPAIQEAFTKLIEKINFIYQTIHAYSPGSAEECPLEAQELMMTLIRIQIIINGVSKEGLRQLQKNYKDKGDQGKSDSLEAFGKKAFDQLNEAESLLSRKLTTYIPELQVDMNLERFSLSAKELLSRRDRYRAHLRQVTWDVAKGVTIPFGLIQDCLGDLQHKARPTKEALRISANFIRLPTMAQWIPTQGGISRWTPLRIVTTRTRVMDIESGVVGTCERDGQASDNLCNLYYRIDPDTKQVVISCGAINSAVKAEQLAIAMNEILKSLPNANGRWIVHQLNSFRLESSLIRDVHAHLGVAQSYMEEKRKGTSILHVNTCFNSATLFKSEDRRSLLSVNVDSLVVLGQFIYDDVSQLLKKDGSANTQDLLTSTEGLSVYSLNCIALSKTVDDIKRLKNSLKDHAEADLFAQYYTIYSQLSALVEEIEAWPEAAKIKASDVGELGSVFDLQKSTRDDQERLKVQVEAAVANLPAQLKEWSEALKARQLDLEKQLMGLLDPIRVVISKIELECMIESSPQLEKALLLFQVFEKILLLQLKIPDGPSFSRCTEIELFLLLYRLLEIKPIIICWSGLDRSGSVRAFSDALAQVERKLFEDIYSQLDKSPENEVLSRLEAQKALYLLIINLDANRKELFTLADQSKGSINPVKDLTGWKPSGQPPATHLRNLLFAAIDGKYGPEDINRDQLKQTQYYLELVVRELLATEAEKTLVSTGAVGFKYLHDTFWPKSFFANFHPLERWPQHIFTENQEPIQLLDSSGWISRTAKITAAAIAIFLRLSKLRGN